MVSNEEIYGDIWRKFNLLSPKIWPTFSLINNYKNKKILEIAPGKIPRAPIEGSYFIDLSREAITQLNEKGGHGVVGRAEKMPFQSKMFDLVIGFEVLEHVEEDLEALKEIYRVLKRGGTFIFAVPLHKKWFTKADYFAGHVRRYEPEEIINKVKGAGFKEISFSVSGVLPCLYSFSLIRAVFQKSFGLVKSDNQIINVSNLAIRAIAFWETIRGMTWYTPDKYRQKTKNRGGVVWRVTK